MNKNIVYFFRLGSGEEHRFDVDFRRPVRSGDLPSWTLLATDRCPNCPLPEARGAHCPAAADLVPLIERFSTLASIDKIDVRVVTEQCEARKRTDSQTALSALMGLILATSACPILGRLRPLAHTHTPFATPTEMVYRIASMHLVGSYLRDEPAGLDGLGALFADIDTLNHAFARRLKRAVDSDAGINALIMLHARAMLASLSIEQEPDNIRAWFRDPLPEQATGRDPGI